MTEQHYDAVVFDAYGTLLDVHAAMARHAKRLGSNWQALATEWRTKQLEYSWIDNMTVHRARRDFAACTADALDYVMARQRDRRRLTLRTAECLRTPRRIRRSTNDAGYAAQTSPGHPLEWDVTAH